MQEETHNEKVENEIEDYLSRERDDLSSEDLSEPPKTDKKKYLIIGSVIFAILLIFAYVSYVKGHSSFASENVHVSIEVSDQTASGEETSFTVVCTNDNKVDLTDAKLEIFFPEDFTLKSSDKQIDQSGNAHYWNIKDIKAKSSERIRIYGKLGGKLGDDKTYKAILSFKSSNFNSDFQAEGTKTTKIASIPVELDMNFPPDIKDSAQSDLNIVYKNISDRDFDKVKIEVEFPSDFIYASSDPSVGKVSNDSNIYSYEDSNFTKGTEKNLKIQGSFQSQNDKETVKARIYLQEDKNNMEEYDEVAKDIAMVKSEILLSQTINGNTDYVANKNETLNYKISFKNQSNKEIRGLVLKSVLDGSYDFGTLKADSGTVKDNIITWSALNVPGLASLMPGGEGSVDFTVKVLDRFDITADTNKNYILKNNASISTFSSATGSQVIENVIAKNEMDSKLRAFLALDVKGYYNDDGRIPNGGSLPPKVGEHTTYTIHWSIRNFFNEVTNVRVEATLPEGVKWTGKYIDSLDNVKDGNGNVPQDTTAGANSEINVENIYYNDRSNQIVWEIPKLKANDGILTPAKEIVFQIEATPSSKDVGNTMPLLNDTSVTAYDTFIASTTNGSGAKISTDLTSSDVSISDEQAIVKQ